MRRCVITGEGFVFLGLLRYGNIGVLSFLERKYDERRRPLDPEEPPPFPDVPDIVTS